MDKNQIRDIVISKVKAVSETLPADQQFEVDDDTVLFGEGSNIDSLSLVSVVVDLETSFSEDHDFVISLTDDNAMTRKVSPYESVRNMVDYIDEMINLA